MLLRQGRCELRDANSELFYFMAKKSLKYVRRKLSLFSKQPTKKFGCFNSLDQASEDGRKMVIDWIERRIDLK
jgi:hypothetical protein